MRTLSVGAVAVLAAGATPPVALLVEMDLSSPLTLNTTNINLVVSGTTYYGTRGLGKIGAAVDTPAEVQGLRFDLAGAASDRVALMLGEPVQGKGVRIKLAILSPATYQVLDARQRWSGKLDVMGLSESGGTATLSVSAEHAGIDLTRPASSLYSHAEQQRLHAGDLFLQFLADQVDRRIVWPAAAFFRK